MHEPGATDLPVEQVVDQLRAALGRRGIAVLSASPGAGKTTVVPLRLLDEPWLTGRKIVMLEPRRLAPRAAARRMASLLGQDVGDVEKWIGGVRDVDGVCKLSLEVGINGRFHIRYPFYQILCLDSFLFVQ